MCLCSLFRPSEWRDLTVPPKGEAIPVASFHMATKDREESTGRISWNSLAAQREEEEEQLKAEI